MWWRTQEGIKCWLGGIGFSNLSKTLKWHCQKMKGPKASRQRRSCQATKGTKFIQDFPTRSWKQSGYPNKRTSLYLVVFSHFSRADIPREVQSQRAPRLTWMKGVPSGPNWTATASQLSLTHFLTPHPGLPPYGYFQTFGVCYSSFCKDWPPWILVSV